MKYDICSECKKYFRGITDGKKINLLEVNKDRIGEMIRCTGDEDDKSVLYYAPAGNFPDDPVVTVCGLATSVQAKEFMQCAIANGQTIEDACLQSVYRGHMAVNLCLILKALGLEKFLSPDNVKLIVDNNEFLLKNISEKNFGKSGYFTSVPLKLHLTQATCCWSKKGSSTFLDEWIGYSKCCREEGYLRAILHRFIHSKTAKVFFFLGKSNLCNLDLVKKLLPADHKIKIMSPDFSGSIAGKNMIFYRTIINDLSHNGNGMDEKKLICYIHHPANTGYVYNNFSLKEKSILYRYFEQKSWDFKITEKYGNVSQEKLKSIRNYYEELNEHINCLIKN